jgi:heavy metal translocating P-type ATPase
VLEFLIFFCIINGLYRLYEIAKLFKKGESGTDILAVLAICSTLFVGEYMACLVVIIMTWTGDFIERYAQNRAKKTLTTLKKMQPTIAHLKDGSKDIPVGEIKVGDIILIKPGEITPTEGILTDGVAIFDESSITGEVAPIRKSVGDKILSGTKNGNTSFYMRALATTDKSEYQKIIDLVAKALNKKPKLVSLASKYSIYFTFISVFIALGAYFITKDLEVIARVLVLATPCPLLIAAPVAFLGAINAAAKRGIIIKNSNAVQTLTEIKSVAFDKTGTLTIGAPKLVLAKSLSEFSESEIKKFAASLEKFSSHPLARAFQNMPVYDNIENIQELTGKGISGDIKLPDGKIYNISIFKGQAGGINSYLYIDGKKSGQLFFEDVVRPDAVSTIANLRKNHITNIALLTGDNFKTAENIAKTLDINKIFSDLRPIDKVDKVKQIQPKPVLFVGDGINDAPVLANANLGLAISHGNLTAASESADIIISGEHLCDIPRAFRISIRTIKIAKQSMIGGIFLSVGAMLFAAFGFIPTIYGAIGQEFIDILAIANGLRASFGADKL